MGFLGFCVTHGIRRSIKFVMFAIMNLIDRRIPCVGQTDVVRVSHTVQFRLVTSKAVETRSYSAFDVRLKYYCM